MKMSGAPFGLKSCDRTAKHQDVQRRLLGAVRRDAHRLSRDPAGNRAVWQIGSGTAVRAASAQARFSADQARTAWSSCNPGLTVAAEYLFRQLRGCRIR